MQRAECLLVRIAIPISRSHCIANLRHSVGDTVEGQGSGCRAVGGVGSEDLGGVDNSSVGNMSGGGGSCESKNGGDGVLHLEGWVGIIYLKSN